MKILPLNERQIFALLIAIIAGVFGGFYSFISDESNLSSTIAGVPASVHTVIRIVISILLAITLFVGVMIIAYYRSSIAKMFGATSGVRLDFQIFDIFSEVAAISLSILISIPST